MEAHPALPQLEDVQRILEVVVELVEERVPQTASDNHAQDGHREDVLDDLCRVRRRVMDRAKGLVLEASAHQQVRDDERQQIHQGVPVDLQSEDSDRNRVDVREGQHEVRHGAQHVTRHRERIALAWAYVDKSG